MGKKSSGMTGNSAVVSNTAILERDSRFDSGWLSVMSQEPLWTGGPDDAPGETPPEAVAPKLTLLLAEDNLPDALLVREAIKMENLPLEVYVAKDGERAIEYLGKAGESKDLPCPDVVLLDINLPKVDGFEVLRRIRATEKYKSAPVLIITSSDAPADRMEAARLGAGYFRKPPNYEEFLKIGPVLRRVLEDNGLLK